MENNNGWIEVRDAMGKLLCRYREQGHLLEVKHGSVKTTIDLRRYQEQKCEKS